MWKFPKNITVAAYPWTQCLKLNLTSEGPILSDVDGQIFNYLVQALHFRYTILLPEGKWGKMDKIGHFDGVYGTLQRREADIGIGCMAYFSEEANIAADHTFPYFLVHPTFCTELPGFIPKIGAFTYPFSRNVWISCLITAIVATLLFHRIFKRSPNDTIFHTFISVIGSMIQQPLKDRRDLRILRGAWLACTTITVFFFTALLLTFLVLPVREKGVQTFEELSVAVQAGKMRSLIAKGSFLLKFIMRSNVPYMRILGETIHNKSWTYDYNEPLQPLINKKTALFGFRSIFQYHFGDSLETSSVFVSEDTIGVWGASIAIRKDFCCRRAMNKVIGWAWASGLPNKWFSDEVFFNNLKRMVGMKFKESVVPLTIDDLSGSFMILASGYALSTVVLIAEITVAAYPWVQCLRLNMTKDGPIFGDVDGKMFYYLVEALRFKYDLLLPEGKWGKMDKDGNFNGVYGTLHRGEADMGIGCMAYFSEEANIAADHTFTYFLVHPTFLTERPGFIPKIGAFTYPFSRNVWISCLVTSIVAALVFHKVFKRSQNDTIFHTFISVIGSMIQQPMKDRSDLRILRGAWLAFTTILIFFFTALLLTFLLLPIREKGVQTFEELSTAVQAGKMKSLIAKGSFLLKFIMRSNVPYMRILGETIHNKSWTYDYNEPLEPLINKKTALFGFRSIFEFHFGDSLETSSVFMSRDTIGVWGASIAIRKGFCCKRVINKVIGWAWASGLPNKWFRDEVFFNNLKRMVGTKFQDSVVPLSIEDLSGSFMILVSGYVLSMIVFAAEVWSKYCNKSTLNFEVRKKTKLFELCKEMKLFEVCNKRK